MSTTTADTATPAVEQKEEQITVYQWLALLVLILGTFLAILDNSLMNVAIPKLMAVFGSTSTEIEWVVTGYMLASAVVVPMGGFLADRFGYKTTFLTTVSAFIVGSVLCGIAWSDTSLIIFRIIQGLGGGFIMPVGMAMLYQIMPRSKIQVAMGIWGISAMAAPAMGPTLSGYLIDNFSWRYLFYINVPIGIVAVGLGLIILKETPKRAGLKFDYVGSILCMIVFSTLLLALTDGQADGWTSFYIVSLFFISISCFILLVYIELGKDNPIMDFRLFKNSVFTISLAASSFVMISMQGGIYMMPIFLQNVTGLTPMQTGLVMMPQSIAMAFMMPVAGKLVSKYGVVPLSIVGLAIIGFTTLEMHVLSQQTSTHWISGLLVIRGIGIGLCMMPLSSAGMNTLPNHLIGRASSVSNVVRNVMASLGIALLTSIMNNKSTQFGVRFNESISTNTPAYADFQTNVVHRYLELGTDASSASGGVIGVLYGLVQKEALTRAIADTLMVSAVPAFIAIVLVIFMRKKKKSEAAEQQSAKDSDAQHHVMIEM
ncbi:MULTISPECIES: DHA2 family efflux MFS transporter permease subunit [Paenibacillus]|uniref:DHA2 family efflux MFS transporter permease subunit n=2 Tax=Paenibacillus TaxID=44249 RepID=A0ABU6DE45_9BACL|nr:MULTISPECIES: DHA2 family efflux MFS transporter permease subunit [Paenibacillus]MBA2938451.1 DHA2 family efflux MFS transporter permease subunit [Paenibacillus sp. CGMCC 1.16610]MCY9658741.1 DHA2 family efflux MFS transporter permease subunit [Paenibacillus anseongense]MEB4796034.1 DHA2 family efflux MFS transporter permease subunit [Paenibacillus chondroitinus]MVQ37509.1 DHA2 family efflux MFS transporter permease subunit [Paenibacillus anseongense]